MSVATAETKVGRKKSPGGPKAIGVSVKAGEEWTQWLREAAEHSGLSVAAYIDQAVRAYAKKEGFEKKTPKR